MVHVIINLKNSNYRCFKFKINNYRKMTHLLNILIIMYIQYYLLINMLPFSLAAMGVTFYGCFTMITIISSR